MTASTTFDVVFVGAGHNALIAASYLAKEGRSVCLLDQRAEPGGWIRSEELTLPGFIHDTFSALHPIFVGGPVFAELGTELRRTRSAGMCRAQQAPARRFPTAGRQQSKPTPMPSASNSTGSVNELPGHS